MQLTRYKLGDLIVQRREKNEGYDVPIRGVSREGFIKPKQQEADTSIYNVFYRNDFVFNPARMELNSIALNLEFDKALCSSLYEIFYIKDERIVLPEFLNLHIKRDEFARHCEYIGSGSAREYCRVAQISEFDIDLPPIDVQQKIVDANRLLIKRIETNKKLIATLEQTAQTLYRHTFVDNIDSNNLPQGWRMGTLGEVCSKLGSGATPKGGKESYCQDGISLIRSTNVLDYRFLYEDLAKINEVQAKALEGVTVESKDVLFNITGVSVARCCMVPDDVLPARVNQHVMIVRPLQKCMAFYLLCTLCYPDVKNTLLGISQAGSTREAITKDEMERFKIIVPVQETLQKFDYECSKIFERKNLATKENQILTKMQTLLLPKMGV